MAFWGNIRCPAAVAGLLADDDDPCVGVIYTLVLVLEGVIGVFEMGVEKYSWSPVVLVTALMLDVFVL